MWCDHAHCHRSKVIIFKKLCYNSGQERKHKKESNVFSHNTLFSKKMVKRGISGMKRLV